MRAAPEDLVRTNSFWWAPARMACSTALQIMLKDRLTDQASRDRYQDKRENTLAHGISVRRGPPFLLVHFEIPLPKSLDCAANLREDSAGVYSDHSDHAGDQHQHDGQHDGVFSDILSLSFVPKQRKIFV